MKHFVIFTFLILFILNSGCSSIEKENKITEGKRKYYLERLKYADEIRSNNFKYVIEISKTAKEYNDFNRTLEKMQRKIETAIKNDTNGVSLDEFFSFFSKQDIIDCSFWKNSKVDIEMSLYILERLSYKLGQSELCNDYFLFDHVNLKCDTIDKNKYLLEWDVNSYNFREDIVIRSILNDSVLRYENFSIDEKTKLLKLKENEKIDGVIFRKLNKAQIVAIN